MQQFHKLCTLEMKCIKAASCILVFGSFIKFLKHVNFKPYLCLILN